MQNTGWVYQQMEPKESKPYDHVSLILRMMLFFYLAHIITWKSVNMNASFAIVSDKTLALFV